MKKFIATLVMWAVLLLPVSVLPQRSPTKTAVIPVHSHIYCSPRPTKKQIDEQISVLNKAFSVNTPFRFHSASISYLPDPVGKPSEIDLYGITIVEFFGLGYWDIVGMANPLRIIVDCGTFPGGRRPGFGDGHTAVHEVGHWLGLKDVSGTCIGKRCNWMEEYKEPNTREGYFTGEQVKIMIEVANKRGIVFREGLTPTP